MSLRDLSDNELIERGRYRRHEEKLQGTDGCAIALVIGTLLALITTVLLIYKQGISFTQDPWWLTLSTVALTSIAGLLVWIISTPLLFFTMAALVSIRPNPYHDEVRRRFMPTTKSSLKMVLEQRINNTNRPAWIIGFAGAALPGGGQSSVLIQRSSDSSKTTIIEIWRHPSLILGEVDPRTVVSHTQDSLNDNHLSVVEHEIGLLIDNPLSSVPSGVIDGLPCTILAWADGISSIQSGSCNLCDVNRKQSEPTILLGNTLMNIASEYVDSLFVNDSNQIR